MVQVTGLEPTRLMRHRHLKLALSVCGTSSASTKSKIWCNSATAVLKCISNKKTSRISTTCLGAGDGT